MHALVEELIQYKDSHYLTTEELAKLLKIKSKTVRPCYLGEKP
jgi:hypothetical protein